MAKGGYKIINLKNVNLVTDAEAVKIEGIFDAIESNYRKALLFSNVEIDGVEKNDFFAIAKIDSGNYVVNYLLKEITITAEDEVTVKDAMA